MTPQRYGLWFALSLAWLALLAITAAAMTHSTSAGWTNGVRTPRVDTYALFGQPLPPPLGKLLFDPRLLLTVLCASLASVLYSADRWWTQRQRTRPRPWQCPACGYDLRASPTRCPECGATPQGMTRPTSPPP